MTMLGGRICRLRTSKQAIARLRNGSSNRVARMERSDIRVLHCESLPARSSCPLRVFSSPSSWRLGKSPDLASLDPGYVLVVSASTRQSRYFHCKEQARNNGPSFSASGNLYRHPRMQERCPIACPARPPGRIPALAFLKLHGCGLLYFPVFFANTTNPPRAAAACVRATKNPARSPARAAGVLSVNTLFWKILVTRVKRILRAIRCGGVSCVSTEG
jgi:hypothetical protein